MLNENIVDQERTLDSALKTVKRQEYHIHTTIEQNNLRFCLKQTFTMLCELRTDLLFPKNYFQLYNAVFDQMKKVEDFMKLEHSRGRRPEDMYESVQQCRLVIPRLYLTITAGGIYIENCPKKCSEILNDLLEQVKQVQTPLREIFTRFFLLKMLKDKLPDKDNIYIKEEGGNFQDTISFLMKNLEEMNRSWIRLSMNLSEMEKIKKEKQRKDLKPLIAETFTRLSLLEGLNIELYENEVLPKLIEISFMYNDPLSQEFIMECIIRAFPDTYNIKCMEFILLNISKLVEGVNVKDLFIILLEKLTKYVEEVISQYEKDNNEENNKLLLDTYNVYPILMKNYDIIINSKFKETKSILDVLELNIAILKYSNKCAPENEKLNSINHILNISVQYISSFNTEMINKDEIDKICQLLSIPLESCYSLFDMPDFPHLLTFLDYNNMKIIGLKIIHNLINPQSREKIDSLEKIRKLFGFIQPLLKNIKSSEEENDPNFEIEQNTVAKLIFVIKSENPDTILDIFNELKIVLYEGGKKRRKIVFPAMVNYLIYFCEQICFLYENKENENDENKDNLYDITQLESDDNFYEFLTKVYQLLDETIKIIEEDFPQMALKLYLLTSIQIDSIKTLRDKLKDNCLNFLNNCINIYNNIDKEKKFEFFEDICQKLLNITILSKEDLEKIIGDMLIEAKNMTKRIEQCSGYMIVSQLYFTHFSDGKKVLDCLSKAKKVADFSLTNPHNLILYIMLLNKYIYYIDTDNEKTVEINNELIEDLIEAINNHMETIKTDKNIDASVLPELEKYFKNTLNLIEKRKNESEHKEIYDSINLASE